MSAYQNGQKAANNGQTGAPPKDLTPRESQQWQQGFNSQQAKNSKK